MKQGFPVSDAAYFHDQKGSYHPPEQMAVPPPLRDKEVAEEKIQLSKMEQEAFERFVRVERLMKEDEKATKLIYAIVEKSMDYLGRRVRFAMARAEGGTEDIAQYQREMTAVDQSRTFAHEALIASLKAYFRYISAEYGPEEYAETYSLYPYASSDRKLIGEWAIALATALAKRSEGSE